MVVLSASCDRANGHSIKTTPSPEMKSTSNPPFRPAFAFAAPVAVFAIVSASALAQSVSEPEAPAAEAAPTYAWKSGVAEGDWCDAANWTASGTDAPAWPAAGAVAVFPAEVVTCRVDRAVGVGGVAFSPKGRTTILGAAAGAALSFDARMVLPEGGEVVFDGMALASTNSVKFENGTALRLRNGSSARVAGFSAGTLTKAATFEIDASKAAGGINVRELEIVLRDATLESTGLMTLVNGPGRNGARIRFADGASRIVTSNTVWAVSAPTSGVEKAAIVLDLANGPYPAGDALIRMTRRDGRPLCSGEGPIVFSAPATAGSAALPACDILVADWTSRFINADLVEFGEVDRDGSYFFFTEGKDPAATRYKGAAEVAEAGATVRCLWYHHAEPPAPVADPEPEVASEEADDAEAEAAIQR